MIFPAKHIRLSESLIGLSAFVLKFLDNPKGIEQLWGELKQINNSSYLPANHSYDNFLLTLDYLYLVGVVDVNKNGQIHICN